MSARDRRSDYSAVVKARNDARKPPDRFGKPLPARSGPAFMEHPRNPNDDTSDETKPTRHEVDLVAEKHHLDQTDSHSFDKGKETGKSITPTKTTSASKVADSELRSVFAKTWTIVSDINIPPVYHDEKSFYTPMMFNIFEVLFAMESNLNHNEELKWICPFYFSLPVRVYYAVISIVTVYRAKDQAGMLTKSEGSWLRNFFRRFKDTQCPIAGPLVPIFTNIAATLPDDDQFGYVYPTIKQSGTYSTSADKDGGPSTVIVDPTHHLIPSIPLIADMLKQFCNHSRIIDSMFDDSGNYVPFQLANGGTLGGVNFPPVTPNAPLGATFAKLLYNPVLMRPLPESKHRLKEIHNFFQSCRAKGYPSPDPTEFNPTQPAEFTGLGESLDWFQVCLDQAVIMNKFFKDSTNLSAIPTTAGQSVTVEVELVFQDKFKQIPTTIDDWYPDVFSDLKAMFRSSNATLDIEHSFQAAYCLTNGEIPWNDPNEKKIGSPASGLRGGPYWENHKYNHRLAYPTRVNANMFVMVQSHFYDAKASQSTVV